MHPTFDTAFFKILIAIGDIDESFKLLINSCDLICATVFIPDTMII